MLEREELEADRLLIEAAQADPARFEDLYLRYVDRVYAYALSRARDRARAEDVTAETFHRALTALPRFEWRGAPLSAWLIRIASNLLARSAVVDARGEPVGQLDEPDFAPEVVERARLYSQIAALPDDQRRVLLLRFGEERSIADTASAMGRSEGAIKQLQRRALASIRERMEEDDG